MIIAWLPTDKGLQRVVAAGPELPREALWIDLVEVTRDEELMVERCFGIEVPTREEMQEIEASSRLYREGQAVYMSSTMLIKTESDHPETTVVTFIYTPERLITLRYAEPWSFRAFTQRLLKPGNGHRPTRAEGVFLGLMETTVERLADMIERVASELELFSQRIFVAKASEMQKVDLQALLHGIGRCGNMLSKVRESLVDKNRLIAFSDSSCKEWLTADARERIKVIVFDIHSLADHASFTSGKLTFLLDAVLGLITIEQNRIIKIFSIASVVLLPPTVVASIYGMNFKHMPELHWALGYPMALGLMVAAGVLPVLYFKRRHWL